MKSAKESVQPAFITSELRFVVLKVFNDEHYAKSFSIFFLFLSDSVFIFILSRLCLLT